MNICDCPTCAARRAGELASEDAMAGDSHAPRNYDEKRALLEASLQNIPPYADHPGYRKERRP